MMLLIVCGFILLSLLILAMFLLVEFVKNVSVRDGTCFEHGKHEN